MNTEQHKRIVEQVYGAFRAGDPSQLDGLYAEPYFQHNPQAPNGIEGVKGFIEMWGPTEMEIHRLIAEGDFVVSHVHVPAHKLALIDVFRFGADGLIAEHWDVMQEVPETTASGNDMFSQLS